MQMTKITNDRGYNLGYAEVSHPGISKGIDKLNKLVGTEVIKEVAKLHLDRSLFSHPQYLKKNSSLSMNVWKHDLGMDPFSEIFSLNSKNPASAGFFISENTHGE